MQRIINKSTHPTRRALALSSALVLVTGLTACGQNKLPEADAAPIAPSPIVETDLVDRDPLLAPRAGEGGFSDELNARIDALIASFDADGPTTVDNVIDRGQTLYDWANAVTVDGGWIHPDLVALVGVTQQPRLRNLNPRVVESYLFGIDNFIRELRLRREKPDAFGGIAMEIVKPAIVNDFHSVKMTYTVGSESITTGGGIIAPNHFRFGSFEYQTEDPTAPNYVTIETSNPTVQFDRATFMAAGQYSTNLYAVGTPRLFYRIKEGQLEDGDTVTLTFGDVREGSPGLQTLHYSNTGMRYPIWILTAPQETGGILHSLPELPVPLLGGEATAVKGFLPAMAAVGEEGKITIRTEDSYRNRAEAGIPDSYRVTLNGDPYREISTNSDALATFKASFDKPGVYRFSFASLDGAIVGDAAPILVEEAPKTRIYWGETHGHSGWAEGLGVVDAYFQFARDESRLDYITLSEHDLWMDLGEWTQMNDAVEAFQEDGEFVTFMGYEWTGDPPYGGHHNVLFRDPKTAVLVSQQKHHDIELVYEGLRSALPVDDVLIIPHAHQPGDWERSDPDLETLVEIVSYHGTFEWFGKRYLNQGWEVGFIGSSDDHVGSPGYRPRAAIWSPGSDNFGGIAAAYAPSLDRDSIFDALRSRNAYATNGMRIILQSELNGRRMGTRLPQAPGDRELLGRVIGTDTIADVTLVKNGEDFQTIDYEANSEGDMIEVAFHFDSQPRTRRRSHPDATFIGDITLSGMTASKVEAPVAESLNSLSEFVKRAPDGDAAEFRLRSGGRWNTIQLTLDPTPDEDATVTVSIGASLSRLALFKFDSIPPVTLKLSDLGEDPIMVPIDGEGGFYSMRIRRIAAISEMDKTFSFTDTSPAEIGDYYYIRTRQRNGGIAWSSPWWVGEPVSKVE